MARKKPLHERDFLRLSRRKNPKIKFIHLLEMQKYFTDMKETCEKILKQIDAEISRQN